MRNKALQTTFMNVNMVSFEADKNKSIMYQTALKCIVLLPTPVKRIGYVFTGVSVCLFVNTTFECLNLTSSV